jgi:hypothetical protein
MTGEARHLQRLRKRRLRRLRNVSLAVGALVVVTGAWAQAPIVASAAMVTAPRTFELKRNWRGADVSDVIRFGWRSEVQGNEVKSRTITVRRRRG